MSRFFGEIRQAGYVAALFIGLAIVAAVPWLSIGFLKF